MKVREIKLHPYEVHSELAYAIAHCIGADSDNDEKIANKIPEEFLEHLVIYIREQAQMW